MNEVERAQRRKAGYVLDECVLISQRQLANSFMDNKKGRMLKNLLESVI